MAIRVSDFYASLSKLMVIGGISNGNKNGKIMVGQNDSSSISKRYFLGLHESKAIQYFCNYCLARVNS